MSKGPYYLAFHGAQFIHGVAIMEKKTVLWETPDSLDPKHSKPLMAWIHDAFTQTELTPKNLTGIITTKGPGSFTGLRNSLSIANAFSLALSCPVIAINSFQWLFHAFKLHGPCGVVLESKREESFCAILNETGDFIENPVFLDLSAFSDYFLGHTVHDSRQSALPLTHTLVQCALKLNAFSNPHLYPLTPFYLRTADVSAPKTSA